MPTGDDDEELNVSFLVMQHKKEVLDVNSDLQTILSITFDREFIDMLKICMFIPFISNDFQPS